MINSLSDFALYLEEEGWEPVSDLDGWYQRHDELKNVDELLRDAAYGRKPSYE
jgi:hypothetical protein